MENPVVSVAEAKSMTRLGMTKLYELFNDGTLETVKVGRRRLVKVDSIKRLVGAA
jgi:excisionase family DNA binding protein